jgi:hypothetical protein
MFSGLFSEILFYHYFQRIPENFLKFTKEKLKVDVLVYIYIYEGIFVNSILNVGVKG